MALLDLERRLLPRPCPCTPQQIHPAHAYGTSLLPSGRLLSSLRAGCRLTGHAAHVTLTAATHVAVVSSVVRHYRAPRRRVRSLEGSPRTRAMAQLQTRAFGAHLGASCAGCGTCRSTSLRRTQCRALPSAPPAQLRAASIAPLRAPRPALASPKPRVVVVEAKQRKPTPFTPELSVWQTGGCRLCDAEFTPVRRDKAQRVAKRHYGGRTHYVNEKHAELMMRTFHLHDVHQLLRCDYGCVCGLRTWWRPMAIHLRESKECLAELESSGDGSAYGILDEADSDDADSSEDEDDNGYADDSDAADDSEGADDSGDDDDIADEALEMPEEESFWRC